MKSDESGVQKVSLSHNALGAGSLTPSHPLCSMLFVSADVAELVDA
jgi:hypothetical protein